MSWRLHGSAIFTFSLVSCPNPKIVDFWTSFGSLLGPFWLLCGRIGLSWTSRGRPWAPQGPLFGRPFFRWIFRCSFGSVLDPQTLQNGRGPSSKLLASLPLSDLYEQGPESSAVHPPVRAEPSLSKSSEAALLILLHHAFLVCFFLRQGPTRNLPETYQDQSRNLPGAYQEPARNLPGICHGLTGNLPGTYQKPTTNLPGTYKGPTRNTRNLPGTSQDPHRNLPGTYQEPSRN